MTIVPGETVIELGDTMVRFYEEPWESGSQASNMPLREAIEALCYGFLEQNLEGWENDDGAYGEFRFDVLTRTIEVEFNERYTAVETKNYSL